MSKENKAIIVIVAPNNYDVKKYDLFIEELIPTDDNDFEYSELRYYKTFEFNQTDENGNLVAIVECPELLKDSGIALINWEHLMINIEKSKTCKTNSDSQIFKIELSENHETKIDNLLINKSDETIDSDSQIFKIELSENHKTIKRSSDLCYEHWTEEQLNEYERKLSKSNKAVENDKIPLKINCKIKNANSFLLDGEFHSFDDEDDKICLEKNKKYKIELVHYDAEKQRFYYFPESNVYEFDVFDTFPNEYHLNHKKQANLKLGLGIPVALAAIGFAFALAFGGLPAIIALPFIIGLGILGGGLTVKGSYDKHYILKEPKEDKSHENETENLDNSISHNKTKNLDDENKPLFQQNDHEQEQHSI